MNYDATQFDNTYAQKEGWALFDDGDIQRLDEADKFPHDADAIAHVRKLATAGSEYHMEAWEIHERWANRPQHVPAEILEAIYKAEIERIGGPGSIDYAAYFPNYSTDSPGYSGPLVVVVWAGDPGAVSTFIQPLVPNTLGGQIIGGRQIPEFSRGPWTHCNSSSW